MGRASKKSWRGVHIRIHERACGIWQSLRTARPFAICVLRRFRPTSGMQRLQVIDSHTAGEPTRVVIAGGPDLGVGTVAERLVRLREEHDWLRRAVVLEPRGSDVMVGALLLEPTRAESAAGVIFFNNVGYLQMCGHGTIGVVETLRHLGRLPANQAILETCVGEVTAWFDDAGAVTLRNVPSYRKRGPWPLEVPGYGMAQAEVAWGGNWFLLLSEHGQRLELARVGELTAYAQAALQAARAQGESEIDHVELVASGAVVGADGQNFVLCPGGAYDRSPCGTGTSAKLACLYAEGKLSEGQRWRQAGILGTVLEGSVKMKAGLLVPYITGRAHLTAESTLILNPADPFAYGIGALPVASSFQARL